MLMLEASGESEHTLALKKCQERIQCCDSVTSAEALVTDEGNSGKWGRIQEWLIIR